MRLFVTGATGFIGRHLTSELRGRGHSVVALVRDPRALHGAGDVADEVVCGDLFDDGALRRGLRGAQAVVHLAGILRERSAGDFLRVHAAGTRRVLSAAAERDVARFVHVSSVAAAGPSPRGAPLVESTPPRPVSAYGRSKLAGEQAVMASRDRVPSTIVRPPAVYGPGDRVNLLFARMARRGTVWSLGDPESQLSVILVSDLARGIADVLEHPAAVGELYYLAADMQPRFADLVAAMARAVGGVARVRRPPAAVASLLALACDGWSHLTGRPTPLSRDKLRELRASGWTCSAGKANVELRWHAAVEYEEGIRRTIDWYREKGWLT